MFYITENNVQEILYYFTDISHDDSEENFDV